VRGVARRVRRVKSVVYCILAEAKDGFGEVLLVGFGCLVVAVVVKECLPSYLLSVVCSGCGEEVDGNGDGEGREKD
jgi:hypothetical protein